jgi:hypothetical protein
MMIVDDLLLATSATDKSLRIHSVRMLLEESNSSVNDRSALIASTNALHKGAIVTLDFHPTKPYVSSRLCIISTMLIEKHSLDTLPCYCVSFHYSSSSCC